MASMNVYLDFPWTRPDFFRVLALVDLPLALREVVFMSPASSCSSSTWAINPVVVSVRMLLAYHE